MALSGDFLKITLTQSDTEFETTTVSYPAILQEGDRNYEKRGTVEEVSVPVTVKNVETLENKYVIITGLTIEKINLTTSDVGYAYRVFNSQEERQEDINSHIESGLEHFDWDDSSDVNPWVRCYEHLKSLENSIHLSNS